MLKNEVLIKSSQKLKNKRSKHVQVIEEFFVGMNFNFFFNQIKLRYVKSIFQFRFSLLPSYCRLLCNIFSCKKYDYAVGGVVLLFRKSGSLALSFPIICSEWSEQVSKMGSNSELT